MITKIKNGRVILQDSIVAANVYFDGSRITAVSADDMPFDQEIDAGGLYVAPGFIDIHTHGGCGFNFTGSAEEVVNGCNYHLQYGTTSICPTISTAAFSVMSAAVKSVAEAMKSDELKANILGAHMEGPYLCPEQCGAQNTAHITPPKPEEYKPLIEEYGDVIARWSYAPENDKDTEFARYAAAHGAVLSAGHTNAIYPEMLEAMKAGCKLVTHLYSCTSTVTRDHGFRRLGVIETAYLEDDMYVEIIADGKHLPPDLIRLIIKSKGRDKVALITDSLKVAGIKTAPDEVIEGRYVIEDGVCKLLDRTAFAGSIATADRLIRVVTKDAGFSLVDAVYMLTKVPAEIMGVNKGVLEAGRDADIIMFDEDINVKAAIVMGKQVI